MRDYIVFYLNGQRQELRGQDAFMTLANYLRQKKGLTGTKLVCEEGDCGACSVLIGRYQDKNNDGTFNYVPFNSCIAFMSQLDLASIITVEGIGTKEKLHPIQASMMNCHGAQCGFCTPGFICAMTSYTDKVATNKASLQEDKLKNALTGNLCRCTGYKAIIDAGLATDLNEYETLNEMYPAREMLSELKKHKDISLAISAGNRSFHAPVTKQEILEIKAKDVRVISGATDLGVLYNKGKWELEKVVSFSGLQEAYELTEDDDYFYVGAKVNLHEIEKKFEKIYPEFSRLIHVFASPQIKNKATLVGNVANGSPIGDSLPFLYVVKAIKVLESKDGVREVKIADFYKGYKDFNIKENEVITKIKVPKIKDVIKLYKVSARKDLDISAITMAARLNIQNKKLIDMELFYGGVGPTIIVRDDVAQHLVQNGIQGKSLIEAQNLLKQKLNPLSDLRGDKEYRKNLAASLLKKCLDEISRDGLL